MAQTSPQIHKTTLILSHDLYLAVRIMALERGTTLKDIATEALRDWLRKQENAEDLAAIAEVEHEETVPLDLEKYAADLALAEADDHDGAAK